MTYRECADVMREALAALARGQIQQPLRTVVRPREATGFMGLMPAYSPEAGYALKALVITPGNPAVGKDAHQGGVLLSDVRTGEPLALINASAITEVRTAAVSAVATDLLATPGAAELAIIGIGVQGQAHAHAIAAGRTLTGIRLAGRDLARTREVAAELAGQLGQPVTAYDQVPAAVDGAPPTRPSRCCAANGWPRARTSTRSARACRGTGSSTPRSWPRRPSSRTAASRSATRPETSCWLRVKA
jgi:ornithine cyclodeaminase